MTSTPLSPAAQAVMDAFLRAPVSNKLSVAAVLRTAADQVVPADQPCSLDELKVQCRIRAIAAELEGAR